MIQAGSLYLLGNLFNKAIIFLATPIFTRLLTTDEYGIVNTYLAYFTIISVFVSLSLGATLRNAYIDFNERLNNYVASTFLLQFILFIFYIIFTFLFFKKIRIIGFPASLILIGVLHAFFQSIIDLMSLKYMMDLSYKKRTALLIVPNVLITVCSIILILCFHRNKYMGRILSYLIVLYPISFYYFVTFIFKHRSAEFLTHWKYAIRLCWPLVFHSLSMVILSNSDRIMISSMVNSSETGIYSLIYNFSMIPLAFMTALEGMWIPWFTKKMQQKAYSDINDKANLYITIMTMLIGVIMLIAPEILVLMAPSEYWSGKYLIPPIVLSSYIMFLYSIPVNLEYFYKSTSMIAASTVIAAITNVLLNWCFIPIWGSTAAAYTTLFSYTISFLLHRISAKKLNPRLFPRKLFGMPLISCILLAALSLIFINSFYIRWIIAVGILLLGYKKLSYFLRSR